MTTLPTRGAHIDGQAGGNPLILTGANAFTPGSLLIACATYITTTFNAPTGWTLIMPAQAIGSRSMALWAKIRDAADGDTYSFTFNATNAKRISITEYLGTDGIIGNLILGSFNTRANSGAAFKNTAPGIATPVANCLVATFSGEATTATEASLPVVTGATKWYDAVQGSSSTIEQITVATQAVAAAGATSAVDITYPNTHGSNGGAIQIGMRPAPDVIVEPAGMQAEIFDGANLLKYNVFRMGSDSVESRMSAVELAVGTKRGLAERLADPAPLFIAHRGGSANWPEHSPQAYWESAVVYNMDAIEISTHKSADGTFWASHDTTTTRATGVTGTIATMTDAQLSVLNNISANTDNPSQPSSPMVKLADLLAKYAGKRIIFIEDKTYANQGAVADLCLSYASNDWFVWKQDGTGNKSTAATSRNLKTWGYFFDGNMAASFAGKQAQWDFVGLDYNSSGSVLAAAVVTAGAARVLPHILPTAAQRDRMLALGPIRGCMVANVRDILAKGSAFSL